jgi:hypothetical protein
MGGERKQQKKANNPAGPEVKGKERELLPDLGQKPRKKRPRGRPWPKGVSGNPRGRPKGARNKFTQAVLEGIRRAEEKIARPKLLDRDKPYEAWDGFCLQEGLLFGWDPVLQNYVALPDQAPPRPPRYFDPSQRCTEMTWKGRFIYVQNGWPFNPRTWRRLRI